MGEDPYAHELINLTPNSDQVISLFFCLIHKVILIFVHYQHKKD